jgi:hypothetical protein
MRGKESRATVQRKCKETESRAGNSAECEENKIRAYNSVEMSGNRTAKLTVQCRHKEDKRAQLTA